MCIRDRLKDTKEKKTGKRKKEKEAETSNPVVADDTKSPAVAGKTHAKIINPMPPLSNPQKGSGSVQGKPPSPPLKSETAGAREQPAPLIVPTTEHTSDASAEGSTKQQRVNVKVEGEEELIDKANEIQKDQEIEGTIDIFSSGEDGECGSTNKRPRNRSASATGAVADGGSRAEKSRSNGFAEKPCSEPSRKRLLSTSPRRKRSLSQASERSYTYSYESYTSSDCLLYTSPSPRD